ncbi:uncharacterized protein LOC144637869 [Oculina patagonica]
MLMLSNNPITTVEPEAFTLRGYTETIPLIPQHIHLQRTRIKILSMKSFYVYRDFNIQMSIINRMVGTLKHVAGAGTIFAGATVYLNYLGSEAEIVKLRRRSRIGREARNTLLASGFEHVSTDDDYFILQACPPGTFSFSSSRRQLGCTKCPPEY